MTHLENSYLYHIWLLLKKYYPQSVYHRFGSRMGHIYRDSHLCAQIKHHYQKKPAFSYAFFWHSIVNHFHRLGSRWKNHIKNSHTFQGFLISWKSIKKKPLFLFLYMGMVISLGINISLVIQETLLLRYLLIFWAFAFATLLLPLFLKHKKNSFFIRLWMKIYPEN